MNSEFLINQNEFQVLVNDIACVTKELKQYRFPKSKKVRIRKKWAKNRKNFKLQDIHRVINMGDRLFVSSLYYEKLKKLSIQKAKLSPF